jgi:hypothetical protein
MAKTVPLQEALAFCFAAQRINNGYLKNTQRYSEDTPTKHSNKDMVKQHFGDYSDPDFVDFTVTEDDYEGVEIANKHFRRYTMQLLGNSMSDFQKDVFAILNLKDVPFNKLGLLAYVPELVKREVEESKFKKLLRMEYRNSQHIGKVKDPVEGVIKVLNKFWSEQWESFNYVADLNGDLVSFMNKFDYKIGDRKKIKAKVKDHTKNRNFDVNETRLNYSKLYKV